MAAVLACGLCLVSPALPAHAALPAAVATSAATAVAPDSTARPAAPRRSPAPHRGLGTWVDMYDTRLWAHPRATVRTMAAKGVRTILLQAASLGAGGIARPGALSRFIEAAHSRRMAVVAWYLPSFERVRVDLRHSLAAIRYRSDTGQRFDGFGLDIESTDVRRVSTRLDRLLWLSRQIRRAVGPSFSLTAISPSPFGMKRMPRYWGRLRDFPFAELARVYDVISPMGYFTYRVEGKQWAHDYTAFNIAAVRNISGRARVPLHPIGGIANRSSRGEVRGYVQALREGGVLGGSLYDFSTTKPPHWPVLRRIPAGPAS
jgi:hypothetical protein